RKAGTFSRVMSSLLSSEAHKMGKAAFLAPEMAISPSRRFPPVIDSLSIRIRSVFVGGKGAHRQRMNFCLHALAQRGIDQLVASDASLAFEGGADDKGFEMRAVAGDFDVVTGKVIGNVLTYLFRSRQHSS